MQPLREDIIELARAVGEAVRDFPEAVQEKAFELIFREHVTRSPEASQKGVPSEKGQVQKSKTATQKGKSKARDRDYNPKNIRAEVKGLRISTKTGGVIEYSSKWSGPRKALWMIAAARVSEIESLRDHEISYLLKQINVKIKSDNMKSRLGTWQNKGLVYREHDVEGMAGWSLTEAGIEEYVRQ